MLSPEVLAALNPDEQTGWQQLASLETITKASSANATGYEDRKAQRYLKHFVDLGLLHRLGSGKSTSYEIVR